MNIDGAFPSAYLKSEDIKPHGEVPKIMAGARVEEVGQGDEQEQKPVLYFQDRTKMVLNKTNANCLKEMFGPETTDWKGREVILHVQKVSFGANMVDGLRIKHVEAAAPAAVGSEAVGDDDFPF